MFVWLSTYDEKEIPKSFMSKVFSEHKQLRFLGWCANCEIKTYFDGVSFDFKNLYIEIQIYC